jgi:DNA-binding Lrp family transcriptional regulator
LAHHPYGLSAWEIKKITNLPIETIKYNLSKLKKEGYIEKFGSKYVFPYQYKVKDGIIIMKLLEGFVLFSCPHFRNNCDCRKEKIKSCRYIKELPDILLRQFKQ